MKTILLHLFILLSHQLLAQDSIRVTICTHSNDGCTNSTYSKEIEHFDSTGNITEIEHYYLHGCNNPPDTIMRHLSSTLYTYDVNGNVIVEEDRSGSHSVINLKSYDASYRIIANLYEQIDSGITTVTGKDSTAYDLNGNKILFLAETFDGTYWDTTNNYIWQYDVNNRITYTYLNNSFDIREYFYQHDTFPYQITTYSKYVLNGSIDDSTRIFKKYYLDNQLEESWNSEWDDFSLTWNFIDKARYEYDTIANITYIYYFNCPDTLCQDSVAKDVLTYDVAGRLIDEQDYEYGWTLIRSSFTNYSGNLILSDGYHDVEQGCDDWEHNDYAYNSNGNMIYSQNIRIHCTGDTITCSYNILTGDSMLLINQGTLSPCASDTIYPVITLAGGHPPFNLQWTPATGILDIDSLIPRISTDSSITYQLTVTDSIGTVQNVFVPVTIMQSNFHLENDTLVCLNDPLLLSSNGSYSSYQWSTGSTNGVININTTVSDTQTIWLTVQDMQCFYTDTINVIVDICAGITDDLKNIVSIFPNPSNGEVTFDFGEFFPDDIIIVDFAGREIGIPDGVKKSFTLLLAPGIYLSRVRYGKNILNTKIVVY